MSYSAPRFTDRIPLPPRFPFLISEHRARNVKHSRHDTIDRNRKIVFETNEASRKFHSTFLFEQKWSKKKGKKSLLKLDRRSTRSRNPRNSHYSDLSILIETNLFFFFFRRPMAVCRLFRIIVVRVGGRWASIIIGKHRFYQILSNLVAINGLEPREIHRREFLLHVLVPGFDPLPVFDPRPIIAPRFCRPRVRPGINQSGQESSSTVHRRLAFESANHANYRGRIKRTVAEIFQSLPPFNYVKFKGTIANSPTKTNSKPPPPPSIDTIFYFIVFTLRAHPNFSKISSFSHSSSSQRVTHPSIRYRLDIHVFIKASKQNPPSRNFLLGKIFPYRGMIHDLGWVQRERGNKGDKGGLWGGGRLDSSIPF